MANDHKTIGISLLDIASNQRSIMDLNRLIEQVKSYKDMTDAQKKDIIRSINVCRNHIIRELTLGSEPITEPKEVEVESQPITTIEIKCNELLNVEGKPMFYMILNNKLLTKIYGGVADNVKINAKNIKLYKGDDEVISFERFLNITQEALADALKEAEAGN